MYTRYLVRIGGSVATSWLVEARRFGADETGATMVEYALMLAFIAMACFSIVVTLGQNVNTRLFQPVNSSVGS